MSQTRDGVTVVMVSHKSLNAVTPVTVNGANRVAIFAVTLSQSSALPAKPKEAKRWGYE